MVPGRAADFRTMNEPTPPFSVLSSCLCKDAEGAVAPLVVEAMGDGDDDHDALCPGRAAMHGEPGLA